MQILIHLGLNKCGSTFIQQGLASARAALRRAGVLYPVENDRQAQYGLSRHYGFGPDAPEVVPRDLGWLIGEARRAGCHRMILSSEYLSLRRPAGIAALSADLERSGAEVRFVLFSREVTGWVRSLFNQYVKSVEDGPWFESINGFIDHALANGAADAAGRIAAWADAVGNDRIAHYRIDPGQPPGAVLRPFSDFAATEIPAPATEANESLSEGALYLTGLLRQAAPCSAGRDRLMGLIAERDCGWVPVPEGYMQIDPAHRKLLQQRVAAPLAALPQRALTSG